MKHSLPFLVLKTLIACLILSPAVAQERSLILETEPERTTIPITASVRLSTAGDLIVVPSTPLTACKTCSGVQVEVIDFDSPVATANVIEIEEGESFVLNWDSLGATACRGQGDFPSWATRTGLPPEITEATLADRTVETKIGDYNDNPYTLKLQCSNGSVVSADTAAAQISLLVTEYVPPSRTSCEGREPLDGWQRLDTGALSCHFTFNGSQSDCREWVSVWSGTFLESGGKPQNIMTNVSGSKQYVAMKFNTNGMSKTLSGQLSVEGTPSGVIAEPVLATISKCHGDFNPEQVTGCYLKPGSFSQFTWRAPNSTTSTSTCILEPDTTYYMNLISTLSPLDTKPADIEANPACEESRCGLQLTPRFNQDSN